MKHISFPSIEQFRNVITHVKRNTEFIGLDENKKAVYDSNREKPTITFEGTVKLHGTNAGVCYNAVDGMWFQSRENIITPEKDNAGFAFFANGKSVLFESMIKKFAQENSIDLNLNGDTLCVFGEWAGSKIQKNVAIANLEKSFFVFGICLVEPLRQDRRTWFPIDKVMRFPKERIYNIKDFPTFSIDIDFNNPALIQNKLIELTLEVENECPVGKQFGFSGIGEGIVFSAKFQGDVIRFKSKGEKHSVSKVKTLAPVDVEKLKGIEDFVEYAVTENRIDQAIEKVFGEEEMDVKKLGDFIRWVVNDITKEETDTLIANGLEPKEINKKVSEKAKKMFFERMNK